MKVIIDTDKKTVEVPSTTKKQLEERNKMNRDMGLKEETILSLLNIEDYKVISKQVKVVKDFTNAETIEKFMEEVRKNDEGKYKEYVELKEKITGHTKTGKPIKTSFLTIKAWYYKNYPEQKPTK